MTTTNRAFIKVYRHDAAEAAAAHLDIAEDRLRAAALTASIEFVAAGNYGVARAATSSETGYYLVGSSIVVAPPKSHDDAAMPFSIKAGLGEGRQTAVPTRRSPRRRIDESATTKKPLSAFLSRHQPIETRPARITSASPARRLEGRAHFAAPYQPVSTSVERDLPDEAEAGTTVASFHWPAVCRAIAQQSARDLDHVADMALHQATLGRTLVGMMGLFPSGGCTTLALCLAAKLAGRRRRMVLVDGNFYHPTIGSSLEIVPTAGWQEVLEGSAPLADALVHAVDDQLDALVLGTKRPFDPLQLATSAHAARTANNLRERYELTIVDLGAFFDPRSQPIALELVRTMQIDTVIAVAGPGAVDARDLATMDEHLSESGSELLGVIENRVAA